MNEENNRSSLKKLTLLGLVSLPLLGGGLASCEDNNDVVISTEIESEEMGNSAHGHDVPPPPPPEN